MVTIVTTIHNGKIKIVFKKEGKIKPEDTGYNIDGKTYNILYVK